jgi:FkbM family methyltransferase
VSPSSPESPPAPPRRGRLRQALDNAIDDAADLARRRLPRGSLARRWLGRLGRLLPRRDHRSGVSRFLLAYARTRPDAFFIQIGSNDGAQQDPLRPVLERFDWRGILVEPVPYVFRALQRHRGDDPRFVLENAAIADRDGTRTFYHLAQATDTAGLPRWYDALGSFNRDVVLRHVAQIPDIHQRLRELQVPCLSFDSLCRRHRVGRVDVLHMDVEGYDWDLIQAIDLARVAPDVLIFEHHHLDPPAMAACRAHLEHLGFVLVPEGLDTLAVRRAALPRALGEAFDRRSFFA